ncbi:hypothetical protein BC828DRAFT_32300 [Blastocladiella britannica]|nr:hypothetical protein BC828DRAFT_32300 [Blastocladiella britannica]
MNDTTDHIDSFGRYGPKHGVYLTHDELESALHHIGPLASNMDEEYIVKAGGRSWTRVKTEAEVAGLVVASTGSAAVPRVVAWSSMAVPRTGTDMPSRPEYVAVTRARGVCAADLWRHLSPTHRADVVRQLAHIVGKIKSDPATRALVDAGTVGCLGVAGPNPTAAATDAPQLADVVVGRTVERGDGPWVPTDTDGSNSARAYIRDTSSAAAKMLAATPVLAPMREVLGDRIDQYLASLSSNGDEDAWWASVPLDLMHGDLNLRNVMVDMPGIDFSGMADDPLALKQHHDVATTKEGITVTAVLDWEWAGVYPCWDEHIASYDFLHDDSAAELLGLDDDIALPASVLDQVAGYRDTFFGILEAEYGLPTPRTVRGFDSGLAMAKARDAIAPWYMMDLVDPTSAGTADKVKACTTELAMTLTELGF